MAASAGEAAVATVTEAVVAYSSKLMSDARASSTLPLSKKVRVASFGLQEEGNLTRYLSPTALCRPALTLWSALPSNA